MKKSIATIFILSAIIVSKPDSFAQSIQISEEASQAVSSKNVDIDFDRAIPALMRRMRQTKDKDARRILINQIRESRKNRLQSYVTNDTPDMPAEVTGKQLPKQKLSHDSKTQAEYLLGGHADEMAGEVYHIPFASSGNIIELSVANSTPRAISNVTVEASQAPGWVQFQGKNQKVEFLKTKSEQAVSFVFSIDKDAEIGVNQNLDFNISVPSGQSWKKTIAIQVDPPEQFVLFQNYPNPFNPSTVISYQLPHDARVNLKIFNILGQEVATLQDDDRSAGYHEERWNADGVANGVYVYQLTATDQQGGRVVERRKMMVIK